MRYDIAIIGTGPAGLEAALTAKIRNKNILVLGSTKSSTKVEKAHAVNNYLGLPGIAGTDMQKKFLDHVSSLGIGITDDTISAVYAMGDYFVLQGVSEMYEASAVILATGVVLGKLYPGEEAYLGKGVSYCATCDGAFYKGKKTVVIGGSEKQEEEADFLTEYASEVLYFPLYQGDVHVNDKVKVVRERPLEIKGEARVTGLVTDKGIHETDGVFILRDAVAPGQLVPGIETDGPHVKVNLDMSTSIPGMFAAGDIAGLPYQYIKSAGQGNVAALSAVSYLAGLEKK